MNDAIIVEDLQKRFGSVVALDGRQLLRADGHRARAARPERRGQDHCGADPHHDPAARCGPGRGARPRRHPRRAGRARAHRPRRAVRRGRREPHRPREPAHGRPAVAPVEVGRAPAGRRAARALRSRRRGRSSRAHLLGRHAPPARPRGRARAPSAGAVPRRADHRPRPAAVARICGGSSRTSSREGTTVLLTTQYLEEADRLADNIVVIDHGRVIAEGTPRELKAQMGATIVEVGLRRSGHRATRAQAELRPHRPVRRRIRVDDRSSSRSTTARGSCSTSCALSTPRTSNRSR